MCYNPQEDNMIFRKIMKRNSESEKDLEARLVKEVETRGGMAIKLTSQFHRGLPDRLVLCPYHTMAFVEMKSTGKKPTALQDATLQRLRTMRFTVKVIDTSEALNTFLDEFDKRIALQGERTADYRAKKKEVIREAKRQLAKERQEQADAEELKAAVERLKAMYLREPKTK